MLSPRWEDGIGFGKRHIQLSENFIFPFRKLIVQITGDVTASSFFSFRATLLTVDMMGTARGRRFLVPFPWHALLGGRRRRTLIVLIEFLSWTVVTAPCRVVLVLASSSLCIRSWRWNSKRWKLVKAMFLHTLRKEEHLRVPVGWSLAIQLLNPPKVCQELKDPFKGSKVLFREPREATHGVHRVENLMWEFSYRTNKNP